jgi:prepilin signal peptidase PulO-like enzyme (type II secretory pathway)
MALLAIRLVLVFLAGTCLGSIVNWAIYTLAWNPRPISPFGPAPEGATPRRWADRVPILGWFALRREATMHGPRFWWRPMVLELAVGIALAALYWWELAHMGLLRDQLQGVAVAPPLWPLHWQFVSHTVLFCWMLAASFIDIDEKIIPDEITVTGTLLGLLLATIVPLSLLPHVAERVPANRFGAAPAVALELPNGGPAIGPGGNQLFLEPVTAIAPNEWPPTWGAPRAWRSLAIGLGCYWLWCFALAPRIWRGSRGPVFALRLIASRLRREFARPPLRLLLVAGSVAIVCVWWFGEQRWAGLMTALVGLVGSGGIVWAVRLIGTAALKREAMGFGDVTLMMMVGTFLGWQACLIAFFIAPFAGLLVGIAQFVLRRDDVIPYGPFLCLGSAAVVVEWGPIWMWGQQLFAMGGLMLAVLVGCLLLLGVMLGLWRLVKEALFGAAS